MPGVNDARGLVRLVAKHPTKALVGHHHTYSLLLVMAGALVASSRLGRLASVFGSAQFYKPAQYFLDGRWRTQPDGGPIVINHVQRIGNLHTLMGEITSVQARASSAVREFAVVGKVAINFGFADGVLGTFVLSDAAATSMGWEQTTQANPAYPGYVDVDCHTVSDTQGSPGFPTMRMRHMPVGVQASWWQPYLEVAEVIRKAIESGQTMSVES